MFSSSFIRVLGLYQRRKEELRILSKLVANIQSSNNSWRSFSVALLHHGSKIKVPHVPVMANEVIEYLRPLDSNQIIVDMNFGAGGHTKKILDSGSSTVKVIALDRVNLHIRIKSCQLYQNRFCFSIQI
jgi:hypothetical protein